MPDWTLNYGHEPEPTPPPETPAPHSEPRGAGQQAATEVPFTPAWTVPEKIEPGTGYLQPGGLVVHTGWSRPDTGEPGYRDNVLRQHRAYEGGSTQCWYLSTPDGRRASRFLYLTRPDAEAAAARITTALPGGTWPATAGAALLARALEISSGPAMLPLTRRGKPTWGSGYGGDLVYFLMPDTRAGYEQMIAAHGQTPKNCQACARLARAQKRAGFTPRTRHWPSWKVPGHRGSTVRPHCMCTVCMGIDVRMGTFGTATDDDGNPTPGSIAVYPWSPLPDAAGGGDVDRDQRAYAWFAYFLKEGGCVVLDERPGVNLWPAGVRHDDALFCETGSTGADDPRDPYDTADPAAP
jgi:hypothetical protein